MEMLSLSAIPLTVNGMITPVPLARANKTELAELKRRFARQVDDGCYARLPENSITRLDPDLLDQRLLLRHTQSRKPICALLAAILSPMADVALGFADWGATVENAAVQVRGGIVAAGQPQIQNAERMHVDASIMRWIDGLKENRLSVRGLLATSHGAEVCDLSHRGDAIYQYNLTGYQDELGDECRQQGLTQCMQDGEWLLMDMMTLHRAQLLPADTRRVLVDCAITFQLPQRWRRWVEAGRLPRLKA